MIKIIIFIILLSFLIVFLIVFLKYIEKNKIHKKIEMLKKNKKVKDKTFIEIPKYYINLDRSEDRNKKFITQMSEYGIKNFKRIKAFDGNNITNLRSGIIDNYEYYNYYGTTGNKHEKIEFAVTLSHIKAIISAYEDNCDFAVIMEDDINLCTVPYWKFELKDFLNENADIILLANNKYERGDIKLKKCPTAFGYANGVCYIVTKKGMLKAKDFMVNNKYVFLEEHNLCRTQATVFDRGFLNYFEVYYVSKSLFISEDLQQKSLVHSNTSTNDITKKLLFNEY